MLHVDKTLGEVVRVQIPRHDREWVVGQLAMLGEVQAVELPSDSKVRVVFVRTDSKGEFLVRVTEEAVEFRLPLNEIEFLMGSLKEHIAEEGEYELDHPFEPLGASMCPSSLKDVVIETSSGK
jgi:hypothetical protein